MSPETKEKEEFIIKDKRSFSSSGERRNKEEKERPSPAAKNANIGDGGKRDEKPKENKGEGRSRAPLPEANFSNFIFSLSTSALVHLGAIHNPVSKKSEENLPLAKHTIDTINMIKRVTKGNLSQDEETLLEKIIYDLQMYYVSKTKRS